MGAPTKKTEANARRIVALLKKGNTRKTAYMGAGVSHTTFAEWIKENESFLAQVEAAEQQGIAAAMSTVRHAAEPRRVTKTRREMKDGAVVFETVEEHVEAGDWRAAAWFLEKKDPENFGKRLDVTSMGEKLPSTTVLVGLNEIAEDEIDRRIAEAQRREAAKDLPAEP